MKPRKRYSLEEDLAVDGARAYEKRMPWYYQVLLERIKEYDPEGKKAHAIAKSIMEKSP